MSERRVFVFRIDYSDGNEFVGQELRAGRLRQGWGAASLIGPGGDRTYAGSGTFVDQTMVRWEGTSREAAQARYDILYPMLEMKAGDLVVVPKFPDPYGRTFIVAEVTGDYRFEQTAWNDYGHVIPVNAGSIREFGHDDSLDAKRVSGKFTSYRRAINNVWNEVFLEAVNNLWVDGGQLGTQGLKARWGQDVKSGILEQVRSLLHDLPPSAIEDLVRKAFVGAGYEFVRRHQFDGRGGDADLVFDISLPLLSEVQDTPLKMFVQVKKRVGSDKRDTVGLDQLMRIAADEPMALKTLFTTADEVSPQAAEMAQENGITIICGEQAAGFLARGLVMDTELTGV